MNDAAQDEASENPVVKFGRMWREKQVPSAFSERLSDPTRMASAMGAPMLIINTILGNPRTSHRLKKRLYNEWRDVLPPDGLPPTEKEIEEAALLAGALCSAKAIRLTIANPAINTIIKFLGEKIYRQTIATQHTKLDDASRHEYNPELITQDGRCACDAWLSQLPKSLSNCLPGPSTDYDTDAKTDHMAFVFGLALNFIRK